MIQQETKRQRIREGRERVMEVQTAKRSLYVHRMLESLKKEVLESLSLSN